MQGLRQQFDVRTDPEPLVPPGGVQCHAADLTFTAAADVSLARLDAELCRLGQWFPADAADGSELGLMVEHDATGPLRLGYGAMRDLLLGVQFEDGRGRLVTVGGRVMKNVAGYDLTKFMVGQRGVFGRVVTVTLRSYRRPEAAVAAQWPASADPASLRPLPSWCIEVRGKLWAGWLGDAALASYVAERLTEGVGVGGSVQMVRHGLDEDRALRSRLWQLPEPGEGSDEAWVELRVDLPPGAGKMGLFAATERLVYWLADPWHGRMKAWVPRSRVGAVRAAAWAAGGRAEAAGWPVQVSPGEAELLKRLKRQMDPEGRLAPLELEVMS